MNFGKLATLMVVLAASLTIGAYAADVPITSAVSATVSTSFSLQFFTSSTVLYSTTVPFTTVSATSTDNLPDTRTSGDGKADVGLLVTSNKNTVWYLKMNLNSASPLAGKLKFYMTQPTNRNTSAASAGTLGQAVGWTNIASSATTIYTGAAADLLNTPLGILATLNFKIDGTGLTGGSKTATITYTLTETA